MATPVHPAKKLAAMPSASELISFEHGAAGHQGISSNASGSLVIKPCVQAEITFYESAKDHPLFQAHLPTYIGSLSESDESETIAPLLEQAGGIQATGSAAPPAQQPDPTPGLTKRATWKPSGGKKLSTGLAIVLENVTAGFKHPNVLDVKLGARLWDDEAPVSKRRRLDEVSADTTSGPLGFRVAGMKVYLGGQQDQKQAPEENVEVKNGYKSYNKNYGRTFKAENVVEAFKAYFGGIQPSSTGGKHEFIKPRAHLMAKRMLRELESIQYVLENQESRMYSASVLFVYEGDEEALEAGLKIEEELAKKAENGEVENDDDDDGEEDDDDDDDVVPQKVHEARLIDFAHASWTPGQGPDENALHGIRSVASILRDLVQGT